MLLLKILMHAIETNYAFESSIFKMPYFLKGDDRFGTCDAQAQRGGEVCDNHAGRGASRRVRSEEDVALAQRHDS